jgi:hypothetical protein
MWVRLPYGCMIDDALHSTVHESDGRHYPIGASPATFCIECDLFKPCKCRTKEIGWKQYHIEQI